MSMQMAQLKQKFGIVGKEKVELNQVKKEQTGQFQNKYSVRFNNFQINFYKTLSKFQKYDTIETSNKIKIFSNFYLPIEIVKNTSYEYIENSQKYTLEEAKQIGETIVKDNLNKQIEKKENIVNTYINYNESDTYVETEVIYEVLEEIGTKEKIVF